MNKTKIVATIGPACSDIEVLEKLIKAGVDVARINMSHANHEQCREIMDKIEKINKKLGTYVSVLIDTNGPNVRINKLAGGRAKLTEGDKIRVYMTEIIGDSTKFSINYSGLINDVIEGDIIKLNDGLVDIKVLDLGIDYILCEVLNDGIIENHKSVNIPGIKLGMPFLNEKDISDITFACQSKADFIALSFVSSAEDVLEVNDLLIELKNDDIGIIAKIENERSIDELDEIIKVCDGIMVARGDLGIELPIERVPSIQKTIINKCHAAGKVSIVATEMMASMETEKIPTRAEVSDVANAVEDGADAVMLSGETTIGAYPVETVEIMSRVLTDAEKHVDYFRFLDSAQRTEGTNTTGIIACNVAEAANKLKCKAIVAPTISGYTAKKISRFRPCCLIIAASPRIATVKSLALHYGVVSVLVDELKSLDKVLEKSKEITAKIIGTQTGDKVIVTGGYPFQDVKHTNFMKIEEM